MAALTNLKRPEPTALATALESLAARFGNRLITSNAVREQHGHTTTWLANQPPDGVVLAQDTADIQHVVRICAANRIPVIAFGTGTSLEGQVNAPAGGICIDLRHVAPRAEITPSDLEAAVKASGVDVPNGGTVLLCTGHHERTFPGKEYATDNSGVNVAATEWLAEKGVVHFGIDSMRPGPMGDVNLLVHKACLDLDITHIESLCNLESLLGQGQFTFIGLPMKWRNGTASPIRAVAVFDLD